MINYVFEDVFKTENAMSAVLKCDSLQRLFGVRCLILFVYIFLCDTPAGNFIFSPSVFFLIRRRRRILVRVAPVVHVVSLCNSDSLSEIIRASV